jgi:hypothetical protein
MASRNISEGNVQFQFIFDWLPANLQTYHTITSGVDVITGDNQCIPSLVRIGIIDSILHPSQSVSQGFHFILQFTNAGVFGGHCLKKLHLSVPHLLLDSLNNQFTVIGQLIHIDCRIIN